MTTPERIEAQRRAHEIFDPIVEPLLTRPGVDIGPMFGSEGIRIRGKVFAVVNHAGELMAKLPSDRIDELVAQGVAERMIMQGRPLREWVQLDAGAAKTWPTVVHEAYAYLDRITP